MKAKPIKLFVIFAAMFAGSLPAWADHGNAAYEITSRK